MARNFLANGRAIDAADTIVRYLRLRMGDENRVAEDAIAVYTNARNTIVDHCSASWAVDETISATNAKNVTVQWCIISESLNKSVHPKGAHGYGSLIKGEEITYHHHLYAQKDAGGYPEYRGGTVPVDADKGGMPDDWEIEHALSQRNADDRNLDPDRDGYTNLEEFLNGTNPHKKD